MGASLQGNLKIVTYDDKGEEESKILKNWVTYRESSQSADLHSAVFAIQVALDLRGFNLRVSRFTRRLYFFQKNSNYAIPSIYAV